MCPRFARLVNEARKMVCHCLLIETNDGLVLVDTGLGTADVERPHDRLPKAFVRLTRPRLSMAETARAQIEALGFSPDDVRDVVPTHLDIDHAGGLPDFPKARVHVYQPEHAAAMARQSFKERRRYIPAQWADRPEPSDWVIHRTGGERWFDFEAVRALEGTEDEVLLVPLVGHTHGHCGVAVRRGEGWLLHCGDAYFYHAEKDPEHPRCTVGLRLFQAAVQMDGKARRHNQQRLRELARQHGDEVTLFCAHDPQEFDELAQSRVSPEDEAD
jgi:glyoxylase-like metal-dependent hydrolase (beta-lactamase superfamily II)